MKKTTFLSLLTMLLLFAGGKTWADEAWVKTDPSDLQTGDVIVIVETVNSYAMSNDNGTSKAPAGVSVTVSNDQLENAPDANLQWVVTVNNGNYKFNVPDTENYLYCTNTNNGVRVGTNTNNEFTITDDYLYNTATSRYVGVYKTTPDWRCYTSINNNIKDQAFGFFKLTDDGGSTVTVNKPVITPAGGTYTEGDEVEVTITADEGCTIVYTTDGTEPGMTAGTNYTEPFTVSEDCTVKAIAYDAEGNASNVATATFTFTNLYTSIRELCEDATSTSTPVTVQLNDWICTGVKGSSAYFTDGWNGILLYQSGHGFAVDDKLTGTVSIKLTTYNGCPEITGLTTSTAGLTVENGVGIEPLNMSIAKLDKDMQGCLILLEGVTYNGSVFVDENDNEITPYDTFSAGYTLESDKTYNAVGVAIWYNSKSIWEIAPRTASEFQLISATGIAAPVITPAGGTYTEGDEVEVTITADDDCIIIYTTDGTDPGATAGMTYTEPFTVSESCTVKAVALDVTGAPSDVVTAEFTFLTAADAVPTIGRLCALATSEEQTVLVNFNEWIATGINGNQLYFTDGVNGIVVYERNHGFELGDKLTGTATVTLVLYNECAEVKGLTATTEGVIVEKEATATPQEVAIADLEKDMQGCLVTFEGLTYSNGVFVDDDDNTITPYNAFRINDYPTLLEGKTYNVTGVAIWYKNSQIWEIAPRTADEFELVTSQVAPESSWAWADGTTISDVIAVDIEEEVGVGFVTNSDGAVTYSSSNKDVATINENGYITLVGVGTTTITADVAETETYLADSKSFTLTVTKEGYVDATFAYNDEDIQGQGASNTGGELTATRDDVLTLYANRAYAKVGDDHIKFYGAKEDNPSYVKLSVAEGYAISKIVMTATAGNDIKTWKDQFGAEATIDGVVATWEGMQNNVILYNQATAQARIKTIDVTYIKLNDTGKTVTISDAGYATYFGAENVVLSGEEQFAIAGVITGVEGAVLTVDTLTTCIPSAVPVLLMGAPGEYKVYTHPDLMPDRPNSNLLVGVREDTPAPVGSYVLQEHETVGFFKVVEEDPIIVPAWHAYLELSGVAGVPAFYFTAEDYETGITDVVNAQNGNEQIYNLAGQRLGRMQKGINIVGGKKVLK